MRIVAQAQVLIGGDDPVDFAGVDVVVEIASIGGKEGIELARGPLGEGVGGGRNGEEDGVGVLVALSVVIEEEEELVPLDGAANVSSELVEVIRLPDDPARVISRKNQNPVPCIRLVPDLVITLITPPPARPISAA